MNLTKEYQQAYDNLWAALEIYRDIFNDEKHEDAAYAYYWMGLCFFHNGQYRKSREKFLRALEIQQQVFPLDHPETERTRENIEIVETWIHTEDENEEDGDSDCCGDASKDEETASQSSWC